jgi:hypothetical protein
LLGLMFSYCYEQIDVPVFMEICEIYRSLKIIFAPIWRQ